MAIHNNYNPNYGSNNAYNIDDDVVGADLLGDEFGEQPNTEIAKNLSDFSFIKNFEKLSSNDIENLVLKIKNNKIEFLTISFCDLSKIDLTSFCQAIARNSSVICLKLDYCNLTDTQGFQLLGAVKVNKSLKEIDFSSNQSFSEKFYVEFANILKTNKTLKTVSIIQSKSKYDLKKLADIYADSLISNKTLKVLYIIENYKNVLNDVINLYLNNGTAGIVKFHLEKAFQESASYLPTYRSISKYLKYFIKFTEDVRKASKQSSSEKLIGFNKPDLTSLDIVFKYIADVGLFRVLGVTKHNFQKGPLELNLTHDDGSESSAQINKDVMGLISVFYSDPNVTPELFVIEDSTDLIGDNS